MRALHHVCAGVAIACLAASPARADVSKAWAAAKAHLPGKTEIVVGFDVAAIVATPSFGKLFAMAAKMERSLEQGVALVKSVCKLDPVASIDGVVVGARSDPDEEGMMYVQLKGVDRAGFEACVTALLKATGEKSATVRRDGALTVLTVDGESLHVVWASNDVVGISFEFEKKASVTAWSGQQGALAKAPVMAQLTKVDTRAMAWGAFAFPKPFDSDLKVLQGFGTAALKAGKLGLAIRGTFDSAKTATATVAQLKKDIAREAKSKSTPAAAKKILRALVLTPVGADVKVAVTASEADVLTLLLAM